MSSKERKIKVKGYLRHKKNEDGTQSGQHSHELYITSWGGTPVFHVHHFSGVTSFEDGHVHHYIGTTERAQTGVPHVHRYHTLTTFDNGHHHMIQGITGPAVDLPQGGHIHYFEGHTTVNGIHPHSHAYRGSTGNEA